MSMGHIPSNNVQHFNEKDVTLAAFLRIFTPCTQVSRGCAIFLGICVHMYVYT